MPNKDYTDITMLLDRSGSMQTIKTDIEGGFDAFIAEQRQQAGRCTVSLAQFDDEYESVYTGRDLADVPPLELHPRGRTALLDSIARVIRDTEARLAALPEDDKPGVVIIGIMTDGYENASTEMTHPAVKAVIEAYEKGRGWVFTYLGANQDAIEVGSSLGIQGARAMTYTQAGAADTLKGYSRMVARTRLVAASGAPAPAVANAASFTEDERAAAKGGAS